MAQDFEMDPARVDTLADQIASATSDFGQDLQNVDDQVRNLLGSGWKAEPGSQFHDAFVEWHKGAGQVVEGMAQMVTTLHDAQLPCGSPTGSDDGAQWWGELSR